MSPEKYWQTINTPGKFEGEPVLVRHAWRMVMDGCEDEILSPSESETYSLFFWTDEERNRFGLSADDYALALWESDNGFVNHAILTYPEYRNLCSDAESVPDSV